MPSSEGSTTTTQTAAPAAGGSSGAASGSGSAGEFLSSLPHWLQPGVSPGVHTILRVTLGMLNLLLLYCAVAQVFSPHFEIMFLLSLGLTGSYAVFMVQLDSLRVEAERDERAKRRREAAARTAFRKQQKERAAKDAGAGAGAASAQPAGTAAQNGESGAGVGTDTAAPADGEGADQTDRPAVGDDDAGSEAAVQTEAVVNAQEKKEQ